MKRLISTRRRKTVTAITGTLALLMAALGLAYYLASGDGSVTAQAGTQSPTVTLSGAAASDLYPGQSQSVTISAQTDGSKGDAGVVGPIVQNGDAVVTGAPGTCDPSWFVFHDSGDTGSLGVAPADGSSVELAGSYSIEFIESGGAQEGCQGAAISIPVALSH